MSDASWRTVRAVFLAVVVTCSVVAGGVGFAGSAGAAEGASAAEDLTGAGDVAAQVDVSHTNDLQGSGTDDDPYIITNASQLQAMEDDLDAHYRLGNDIDASNTSSWNSGNGFDPIGGDDDADDKSPGSSFGGTFDGDGYTITGLTIDRPYEDFVGLFGNTSSESVIKSVTITSVDITGSQNLGGVAGDNNGGTIKNVSIDGTITGKVDDDNSRISDSSAKDCSQYGQSAIGRVFEESGEKERDTRLLVTIVRVVFRR